MASKILSSVLVPFLHLVARSICPSSNTCTVTIMIDRTISTQSRIKLYGDVVDVAFFFLERNFNMNVQKYLLCFLSLFYILKYYKKEQKYKSLKDSCLSMKGSNSCYLMTYVYIYI